MINKILFPFAVSLFFTLPTFAMEEQNEDDLKSSQASSSILLYGGKEGNDIFQEASKKVIGALKKTFELYRNLPDTRRDDTLRNLILKTAKGRADIARQTKTGFADEFEIFRLEDEGEYSVTPLLLDCYEPIRLHCHKKILELISENKTGQWIEDGKSRYRLRVIKPQEWPVVYSLDEDNLYQSGLKNLGLLGNDIRMASDKVLALNYLKEFIIDGNLCEGPQGHFINYSPYLVKIITRVLSPIFKKNRGKSRIFTLDWGNLTHSKAVPDEYKDGPKIEVLNFKKLKPKQSAFRKSPKETRFLYLETEHKLSNDIYTRGYNLMGMMLNTEHLNEYKIPLMLCHPGKVYLNTLVQHYEHLLHDAILAESLNMEEVCDKVGLFHRYWTITMPFLRGSAAVGEWIAKGLYESHNYDYELDKSEVASIDHLSYMYWGEKEFLEKYRIIVKLNKRS